MKTIGNWIIMHKNREPFYRHFEKFWEEKMTAELRQGALEGVVHVGFNPGHSPDPRRPRKKVTG